MEGCRQRGLSAWHALDIGVGRVIGFRLLVGVPVPGHLVVSIEIQSYESVIKHLGRKARRPRCRLGSGIPGTDDSELWTTSMSVRPNSLGSLEQMDSGGGIEYWVLKAESGL